MKNWKKIVAHKVNGLHCPFPNVQSMRNKQNEIKMLVKEIRYNLTYIRARDGFTLDPLLLNIFINDLDEVLKIWQSDLKMDN